ncbi:hypothetical protein GCM10010435_24100 [Winogradskya consettensis]|uniref:ABC-2 type transport system permease protein n=1 Tax=Winogradskya consettensis TaxID=113560 RepID=A0A919SZP2_9ACTN|nr:hypothetical protein [Actinoplanes consettensis]GIM82426.1 hypothetical protein Aco04nite_81420 [Actinoplanes consettensis]
MAGTLIRMKLAVIRHSMTGNKLFLMIAGGIIGLALALGTVMFAVIDFGADGVRGDLLGGLYLLWTLGWLIGPLWSGTTVLRAEQFALLGLPRWRLASGLLAAGFAGITTAVTLLALLGLIGYGARLGVAAALVAVPAVVLHLVVLVLLAQVSAAVFGFVSRLRTGAVVTGAVFSGFLVLAQSGWMVVLAIQVNGVFDDGFPGWFAGGVRALPSGWGLAAVEAAGRGDWLRVAACLAGYVVLGLLLLAAWMRSLATPRRARALIRGSRDVGPAARGVFAGPVGAVARKELYTWWRDPLRIQSIAVAVCWAVFTAVLPVTFGTTVALPWTAPGIALMAAVTASNSYAQDGTALWMSLLTGSERADIRGRQRAFLLIYGPITVVVAVVTLLISGLSWAWPWVIAVLPATLGGSAGLFAVVAVALASPGPDAHKRPSDPLAQGDTTTTNNVTFWAALLPPVPPLAVLGLGLLTGSTVLLWAAVPVGLATGVVLYRWLGGLAARRLHARGPELLHLLRSGRPATVVTGPGGRVTVKIEISRVRYLWSTLGWTVGTLALFPQGLVPVILVISGAETRSWFAAMYLPEALRWPGGLLMMVLGGYLIYVAIRVVMPPKPSPAEAGTHPTPDSEPVGAQPRG